MSRIIAIGHELFAFAAGSTPFVTAGKLINWNSSETLNWNSSEVMEWTN